MKNILITGANSGLGFATAKHVLLNGHKVIMACRNKIKALRAKQLLQTSTNNENIEILLLDLADFDMIRTAVGSLSSYPDSVICNAGIANEKRVKFTKHGIEETFAVNHLGHFLLVNLILKLNPNLEKIWIVSSNAHIPGKAFIFPAADLSDLDLLAFPRVGESGNIKRENALFYVNTKLCNVLFTYELDRKLKRIGRKTIVNAFNPGFMPENGLDRDTIQLNKFLLTYIMPLMRPFVKEMRKVDTSGNDLAYLHEYISSSGKYYDGLAELPSSDLSYDQNLAARLWEKSLTWTHLNDSFELSYSNESF